MHQRIEKSTIETQNKLGKYADNSLLEKNPKTHPSDLTICFAVKSRRLSNVDNCLASLRKQNSAIKIVVSDIGSGSRYKKKLSRICNKHDAELVATQHHEFNKSLAFWECHSKITTKYVAYSDIDHIFSPNFIKVLLCALESDRRPLVMSNVRRLSENVNPNLIDVENTKTLFRKSQIKLVDRMTGYGGLIATTKRLVEDSGGWNTDIPVSGHGQEFYLRLLSKGCKEIWIDNLINIFHQPHEKNRQRTAKKVRKHRKIISKVNNWLTGEVSKEKCLSSVYLTDGHAEYLNKRPMKQDPSKPISYVVPIQEQDEFLLSKTLEHLNNQHYPNMEVIIVDYCSSPAYTRKLKRIVQKTLPSKECRVYKASYQDKTWSLSRALNACMDQVETDFMVVWNADIVANADFTHRLSAKLNDDHVFSFTVRYINRNDLGKDLFRKSKFYKYGLGISAAKTSLYREIGGWDDRLTKWGAEDNDLIRRFMRSGIEVRNIYPYCIPYHIEHPKNKEGEEKNRKILKQSTTIDRSNHRKDVRVSRIL